MTNTTLKLIVKFFSLFSTLDKNQNQEKVVNILSNYLDNYIKSSYKQEFISIYNFYIQQEDRLNARQFYKDISIKSVKILRQLEHLNQTLVYKEKILLLIYLSRILRNKEEILNDEYDLLKTIALSLNIPEEEYPDFLTFLLHDYKSIHHKEWVTLVTSAPNKNSDNEFNVIERENFNGIIIFFHLVSAHLYFFYYDGSDELFLNNQRIYPGERYIFEKSTSISSYKMGLMNIKLEPIYYSELAEVFLKQNEKEKVELIADNPEYYYRNSEEGIRPFRFRTESFQLVGIVGSSGVGKSTLLKLLNGTLKPRRGAVRLNGVDVYQNQDDLKGIIGYVPQEDLLFNELTVYQNLYYNAKLCFGESDEKRIHDAVERILNELGLMNIRHNRVGSVMQRNISGGQRKRLNLGLELIREPQLLLVDEPTSGLSSSDSLHIINLLREQSLKGKLVIVNIHQPSSRVFKLLDQLLVMDEGGRIVYSGDPMESLVYFKTLSEQINAQEKECPACGTVNPDIILEIIEEKEIDSQGNYTTLRKVPSSQWYERYKEHIEARTETKTTITQIPRTRFRLPSFFNQFKIYISRNLISKSVNKQYLFISLLEAPLLALLLGFFTKSTTGNSFEGYNYVFSQNVNIPAYLFMSIVVALFIGILISAQEIFKDRKILQREQFLNLSRSGYLLSKVVFLFGLSAIQILTYVLIGNAILEIKGMTLEYWVILFSSACFANMLGLNISSGLKSEIAIYILIPILLIPQILFSGTVVKFDRLYDKLASERFPPVVADLTVSRWAYEAMAVVQFKNNRYEKSLYPVEKTASHYAYRINYYIPELISYLDFYRTCAAEKDLDNPNLRYKLLTLSNELNFLIDNETLSYPEDFHPDSIDIDLSETIRNKLNNLRREYTKALNRTLYRKDRMLDSIDKNTKMELNRLKSLNQNQALAGVVKGKSGKNLVIKNHRIYRQYEPIYKEAENKTGRAQFFNGMKRLGNQLLDTFYFNIGVIWLFVIILYITLYYDLLRKAIAFLSKDHS